MLNTHRIHHATLRLQGEAQRERVRQALPLALQLALDAAAPPDMLWLLRRLPCHLSLAEDASLDEAVHTLQLALQTALRQAGAMGDDGGLLRLRDPCEALNDAFADALVGRRDRAWAWFRLGLWADADTPRAEAARLLTGLLPALDRRPLLPIGTAEDPAPPQRRRALLAALLSRGLLPRALALLAPAQWAQLASGLPGAAALPALAEATPLAAGPSSVAHPAPPSVAWPDGADAAACLAALHSTPLPAARRAAAGRWLAWLAWLHSDAIGLAATSTQRVQERLQAMAQSALHARPQTAARPAIGTVATAPPGPRPATSEPAPGPAPAGDVWRTAHGGLLHLLPLLPTALADAAGGPGEGTGLSRERLLGLAVHGLGLALADPVLAVWLGMAAPSALQVPSAGEQAQVDRAALATAVQALLQRHLPPAERADIDADPLPWLLRRGATLRHGPGRWLAAFDEADTRLRRCGLDRDPGHLPWLGLTVVLRYE